MIEFQIQAFKAEYDESKKMGWLCKYCPYDAVKDGVVGYEQWKNETYGPEILDYKEGYDSDIQKFVPAMTQFIERICGFEKCGESLLLIPIPSSLPKTHHRYKEIFCKMLVSGKTGWQTFPVISRIEEKKPKDQWSVDQQAKSFEIDAKFGPLLSRTPIFLIDDVTTRHTTFLGAKKIIEKIASNCLVFCVAIGKSTAP